MTEPDPEPHAGTYKLLRRLEERRQNDVRVQELLRRALKSERLTEKDRMIEAAIRSLTNL